MKKNILLTLGAVALLAACTEDYKDWASPMSTETPEATSILTSGEASATSVGTIDFAELAEGQTTVKVCSYTAAQPLSGVSKGEDYIVLDDNLTLDLVNNEVEASKLKEYVEGKYGKAPTERTIKAYVHTSFTDGDMSTRTYTSVFDIKVKLMAPFIDEGYYLTGDFAGWNKEGALAFKHIGDGNVYDNPKYQIIFSTTADNQYWKIISKTNYDNDFWAGGKTGVVGTFVDGDTSTEGLLTTDNPQAGKIENAGLYRLTINMMDYTYLIEALDFTEYIYVPGNGQGWNPGNAAALHSPGFDGVYTGYVYLDGGFKFTKARNWNDGEYNWTNFNSVPSFINNGAGTDTNLYCDDPGVYYVVVNVAEGTIQATKINNMNLVGDFNGWNQADDAMQMTWDAENLCYTISGVAVTTNGWKFTANNAWDINLGCNDDVEPSIKINDLVGGGKNIGVAGSSIKLYPCRTNSETIYCTVE